jgi:hypothetical protein
MVLIPTTMEYAEKSGRHSYRVTMSIAPFFDDISGGDNFLERYAALESVLEQIEVNLPSVAIYHSGHGVEYSYVLRPQFKRADFGFTTDKKLEIDEAKKIFEHSLKIGKETCRVVLKYLNAPLFEQVVASDLCFKWEDKSP